jgi:hypothetical protein
MNNFSSFILDIVMIKEVYCLIENACLIKTKVVQKANFIIRCCSFVKLKAYQEECVLYAILTRWTRRRNNFDVARITRFTNYKWVENNLSWLEQGGLQLCARQKVMLMVNNMIFENTIAEVFELHYNFFHYSLHQKV